VNDGKGGLDEIALFDLFPLDDEFFEQPQEFQLAAVEVGVLGDELIKALGSRYQENWAGFRCPGYGG
jgi:hypothetical protein